MIDSGEGQEARPGSIGGAADDAGVEYRRAVAAYAVAYGLAGLPLPGFGPPPEHAQVASVSLETDDPVDDLRIDFTSGWTSLVQAKRRLIKGRPLNEAVAQWGLAAQQGLRPNRDRLIIATAAMSGPMTTLRQALDRYKTDLPGALTKGERAALDHLDSLLADLTPAQREKVRKCALIHQLDVEEPFLEQAREGGLLLAQVVSPGEALSAWHALTRIAGRAARHRGGFTVEGWFAELQGEGMIVSTTGDSPAAVLARRSEALGRYFSDLRRRASHVDLRGLGGTIPPIPMADVDARVRVLLDEDDSRSDADLLWAFLRRGRMVLTGLPGGGKSTAIAVAAGRLSLLSDGPLPIVASLAGIDREDHSLSFRDRLMRVALKDLPEPSRALVREVIEERLEAGGIALLLDALDETYERRADVVMELDQFLTTVSPDVDVLLATRDVAYAQAGTLGWPHLRLLGPQDVAKTVTAIIRCGAESRLNDTAPGDQAFESWVQVRQAWVDDAMRTDPLLRETPLLPVLLSLLAIERDHGTLPTGRAAVLRAVVDDVVHRREARRAARFRIGRLENGEAAHAALDGFALEGSLLVAAGGQVAYGDLVDRLAESLRLAWGLTAGQADEAAEASVRLWDESGIFVISGAQQTVAPRLLLFAEIGDAIAATHLSDDGLRDWVTNSLDRRSIEPVVLAAGLSGVAADGLSEIAVRQGDRELLLAAARTVVEGATLTPERAQRMIAGLVSDVAAGDREGWRSWLAIGELPRELLDPEMLRHSASAFPAEYQTLANAIVDLKFHTRQDLVADPSRLLAVLRVHRLPSLARRGDAERPRLEGMTVDQSLASTVIDAADVLLGAVAEATALIVDGLDKYSMQVHERLVHLLESRGFDHELEDERQRQKERFARVIKVLEQFDADDDRTLLEHLAQSEGVPLSCRDRVRLDELADFLETLNVNDAGATRTPLPDMRLLIDLVARLGNFDIAKISAQAAVVLRRIDETDEAHAPFLALLDLAEKRALDHWDAIADQDAAVDLCLRVLTWAYGSAVVAGRALWGAPIASLAAPKLRNLLPRVASSEHHLTLVAAVLCSLVDGPEPEVWVDSDDSFLRLAAARLCGQVTGSHLSSAMKRLLQDADGTVRFAAVRRLADVTASDRELALRRVVDAGDPGWTCLSCRTFNEASQGSCKKEGCFRAKPHPSSKASELLVAPRA